VGLTSSCPPPKISNTAFSPGKVAISLQLARSFFQLVQLLQQLGLVVYSNGIDISVANVVIMPLDMQRDLTINYKV